MGTPFHPNVSVLFFHSCRNGLVFFHPPPSEWSYLTQQKLPVALFFHLFTSWLSTSSSSFYCFASTLLKDIISPNAVAYATQSSPTSTSFFSPLYPSFTTTTTLFLLAPVVGIVNSHIKLSRVTIFPFILSPSIYLSTVWALPPSTYFPLPSSASLFPQRKLYISASIRNFIIRQADLTCLQYEGALCTVFTQVRHLSFTFSYAPPISYPLGLPNSMSYSDVSQWFFQF